MTNLNLGPEEIVDAVKQVRNPQVDASEYDFLNQVESVHSAPSKKGNDGLANWIADLAVFEVGGETVVDKELVELADEMLGDQHGNERTRMEGIVYNSDARPGDKDSLVDNGVDGHDKLLQHVEEFYKATGREEEVDQLNNIKDLSPNSVNATTGLEEFEEAGYILPNQNNAIDSKSGNKQQTQGGDNKMTKVTDRWLQVQANTRRMAVKSAVDNLTELGATFEEAKYSATAAAHMYTDAAADRDEARNMLERTFDEDADTFNYVAEALDHYDDILSDDVIQPLQDIDHDTYDLSQVESILDSTQAYIDANLPNDPTDLV